MNLAAKSLQPRSPEENTFQEQISLSFEAGHAQVVCKKGVYMRDYVGGPL